MEPINYYAFLTLLTKAYQDIIIFKLVARGYMVGLADLYNNGADPTLKNPVSTVLGLRLFRLDRSNDDIVTVIIDLKDVLQETGAHYYSVCVTSGINFAYIGCNFEIPPAEVPIPIELEPLEEVVPKKADRKLN